MPRTKECSKCGGDFPVMRYRGFQAPEGGWLCGVHGPSGSVATSRGYSCGLPESSASLTGTDADVSAVARGVVGGTEESSASLMGTSEDVCFSPSLSRRKRGRVATGTPVRAAPNSSCNESNESYTNESCSSESFSNTILKHGNLEIVQFVSGNLPFDRLVSAK